MCDKETIAFFKSQEKAIAECEEFFKSRDRIALDIIANSVRPAPPLNLAGVEPLFVMSKKRGKFVIVEINGASGKTVTPEVVELR